MERKKTLKSLTRLYEQAAIDLNLMHNLEACSKWQRSGLFLDFSVATALCSATSVREHG